MKHIFAISFIFTFVLFPTLSFAVDCGAPLPKTYVAAKVNAKINCLSRAITVLQGTPTPTPLVQDANFTNITVTAVGIAYGSSSDSATLSVTLKLKNKTSQALRIQTFESATFTDNMNGQCQTTSPNGITGSTFDVNNSNQSSFTLVRPGANIAVSLACTTRHGGVVSPKPTKLSVSQNFLIFDSVNGNHVEAVAFTDISPR